jgi:F1F0 ATPase subunit 2
VSLPDVTTACLSFTAGLILGLVHFLGLYANTRLYITYGIAVRAMGLHFARIFLTSVGLFTIAHFGAASLLAALAGLLIARPMVRHVVIESR